MGFDCGFDIYPRLETTAANKEAYRRFLDEIIHKYENEYNDEGRREDGKVLEMPTDADASDKTVISFMVGECPKMPCNPDRCNYFLRFSSKISGNLTAPSEPYIRGVLKIAKKHFGTRVHFWHELCETCDEQQYGYYNWTEVYDATKQLRALEEQSEFKPVSHDATQDSAGSPSLISNLAQSEGCCSQSAPGVLPTPSSLPQASMEGSAYAIRPLPDKGQGMIATCKIQQGTRILSEKPLFKVPRVGFSHQVANNLIAKSLKSLDKGHLLEFFALHNAHGREYGPFLGIAKTNVLPLGSDAQEGGLFIKASRINHACQPNAQNTWNKNIGNLTIHALRDIKEGEEITITYLDRTMERAERQRDLKNKFRFDCQCDLCMLPPGQRAESDRRLAKIQSIDNALGVPTYGYDEGLHLVRTMLRLFEEEGIWDAGIPRVYYDAFQIAASNGDKERATVFAKRAYLARLIIEGEDSPLTEKMKQYAARPTLHPAYGIYAKSSKGAMPPPENDDSKFNDWLWRENK